MGLRSCGMVDDEPRPGAYPLIRIRVIDEAASQVLASVVSGESDFGISFMGSQLPGVDFEPIHTDPFVLAMPRKHALAARKSLSWAELQSGRLIAVARSSGNRHCWTMRWPGPVSTPHTALKLATSPPCWAWWKPGWVWPPCHA